MLVITHRSKKVGLHNLVVRRIFSDILLVLALKKVEKHCRVVISITGFIRPNTGKDEMMMISIMHR
jgi:hypothetical protein